MNEVFINGSRITVFLSFPIIVQLKFSQHIDVPELHGTKGMYDSEQKNNPFLFHAPYYYVPSYLLLPLFIEGSRLLTFARVLRHH